MFISNHAFPHHDSDQIKVLSGRDVSVHIKPHIPSSRPGPNKSFIWSAASNGARARNKSPIRSSRPWPNTSFIWSQDAIAKWLTIGHVSAMWQSIILVWLIQVQTPKDLYLTVRVRCWDNVLFDFLKIGIVDVAQTVYFIDGRTPL